MPDYKLDPIKKLTDEIIDEISIHHSVSSLRRAGSVSPCIERIKGTSDVPTLYYIKHSTDPKINDWTIHAISRDILRFLLSDFSHGDTPGPEPEPVNPKIHSLIEWDGHTGGSKITQYVDGGILTITGSIESISGVHLLGIYIIPNTKMIDAYPDATFSYCNNNDLNLIDYLELDDRLHLVFPVDGYINNGGISEIPITVKWSKDFIEYFTVGFPEGSIILE